MAVDLREVTFGEEEWEVGTASIGGASKVASYDNRADAVEKAINIKMENKSAWVYVRKTKSMEELVVVDSV